MRRREFLRGHSRGERDVLGRGLRRGVPPGLRGALSATFTGTFTLVFRGKAKIVRGACRQAGLRRSCRIQRCVTSMGRGSGSLHSFSGGTESAKAGGLLLSNISKVKVNMLKVNLPSVPMFAKVVLGGVCRATLRCKCDCRDERRGCFVLLLVQKTMSCKSALYRVSKGMGRFVEGKVLPRRCRSGRRVRRATKTLSGRLLCVGFLRKVPIINTMNKTCSTICVGQVARCTRLGCQRECLTKQGGTRGKRLYGEYGDCESV